MTFGERVFENSSLMSQELGKHLASMHTITLFMPMVSVKASSLLCPSAVMAENHPHQSLGHTIVSFSSSFSSHTMSLLRLSLESRYNASFNRCTGP